MKAHTLTISKILNRFGFVSNEKIRGYAIRGWNYITHKHKNSFQKYCHSEKSFADCFEKTTVDEKGVTRDGEISGFFGVHGNYFNGRYDKTVTCGSSVDAANFEHARGVVCR